MSHTYVHIRVRWYSPVAVQYLSNVCLLSSLDSNFKVGIQDSLFIKGGIQDSNLVSKGPREIQEIHMGIPFCLYMNVTLAFNGLGMQEGADAR